ncbi:M1 family metallopeptidase [Saprospira grandis]|uniref:Zn-dependent aminopeptidase n=1 Tax=Saprospira grandis (strain Lewin) TaxID=984262 RepID=H6L273_SAPGL|nr:M1 family metallopeptidase [Saprospira grandis]AFC24711.1 putative Zn-dependent aminopeptidase [Saprospira grandis str. Lewin]
MKSILALLLFFCSCFLSVWGQSSGYFQQQSRYEIHFRLNEAQHSLSGHWKMRYQNQSADSLTEIWIHLWPNAYRNNGSPFAHQLAENGDLSFQFAADSARGGIDSLDFSSPGQNLSSSFPLGGQEMLRLELSTPLAPGDSLLIESPFYLKVPASFSRLGHQKQYYQLCQWYPKVAVYDAEGWQPMPYLDQGEFYGEFGDYDIYIELPANYWVAATGELQTAAEQKRLADWAKACAKMDLIGLSVDPPPSLPSDSSFKQLHYRAKNVQDFALFLNKDFYVLKKEMTLATGRKLPLWAFFEAEEAYIWQLAPDFMEKSTRYYSKVMGEYPYPQITAVQGPLGAGGGMEYPMITIINPTSSKKYLDLLLAHEIGHNWWYGILASNERKHPWIDEGFNSYIESRYMQQEYGGQPLRQAYLAYLLQVQRNEEQSSALPSDSLSNFNYYLAAYAKPSLILSYLEQHLGQPKMDSILQAIYEKWQFKHLGPQELQKEFEQGSGQDLDWCFQELLQDKKRVDLALEKLSNLGSDSLLVQIQNKGQAAPPIFLAYMNEEGQVLQAFKFPPLAAGERESFRIPKLAHAHSLEIDPFAYLPDYNRANQQQYFARSKRKRINLLYPSPDFTDQAPSVAPIIGYNAYDGLLLGLGLYSNPIFPKNWRYQLYPLVGTSSEQLLGQGQFSFQKGLQKGKIKDYQISLGYKRYSYFSNERYNYKLQYQRWRLAAELALRPKAGRQFRRQYIGLENLLIREEEENFERDSLNNISYLDKTGSFRSVHRLYYRWENRHPLAPANYKLALEFAQYDQGQEQYLKLSLEGQKDWYYALGKKIGLRFFFGGFPFHSDRDFGAYPLHLLSRNAHDYHYDNYVWGRNVQSGFSEQQVLIKEGGFKLPIANAQAISDGRSNSFIGAINLRADLPIRLPFRLPYFRLQPYFDLGYFENTVPSLQLDSPADAIFYDLGLLLDIGDGLAQISYSFYSNERLRNYMKEKNNFWARFGISINLNSWSREKLTDELIGF